MAYAQAYTIHNPFLFATTNINAFLFGCFLVFNDSELLMKRMSRIKGRGPGSRENLIAPEPD